MRRQFGWLAWRNEIRREVRGCPQADGFIMLLKRGRKWCGFGSFGLGREPVVTFFYENCHKTLVYLKDHEVT
jgi:hypothetical protein